MKKALLIGISLLAGLVFVIGQIPVVELLQRYWLSIDAPSGGQAAPLVA
jgi:hypothetical protein